MNRAFAHRTAWWSPLAFVAFVLVALTITPVFVSYQVRKLRDQLSDGSDAGRVIVNDLEAAFTRQLLVQEQGRLGEGESAVTAKRVTNNSLALSRELKDEVQLDSVARRIGPDAVERFVELRTQARAWHASLNAASAAVASSQPASQSISTSASQARGDLDAKAEDVLTSAQSLDNYLRLRSLDQRAEIRRISRFNLISALILAPLALAAALALFWTGRRILFYANAAERDRLALSKAMVSKAALVRGLTHDLKNPLGAAYGYAELLEDQVVGPVAPEQREMLGRIKGLVTLSVTTVDDLLDLYRDGSNGLQINLVETDITQLVTGIVADFRGGAQQAGLVLTMESTQLNTSEGESTNATMAIATRTDPARVRQILGNLVTNAIKYTPTGGHVWVSVNPPSGDGSRIAVDVRDTGPGIPPADQERVFEEFFRLPSTMGIAGTGVGLAISRRFARLLGGDITVTDWFEGGSVFTLWLPCDTAGTQSDASSPERVA
ncbi:MAG: HAMP domain-containing sensor histidine kinase [Gemmatimonadaceae bacterium]